MRDPIESNCRVEKLVATAVQNPREKLCIEEVPRNLVLDTQCVWVRERCQTARGLARAVCHGKQDAKRVPHAEQTQHVTEVAGELVVQYPMELAKSRSKQADKR